MKIEVGSKIGEWSIKARIEGFPPKYICKCACGLEKEIFASSLYSGKSLGCFACSMKERIYKRNIPDIVGKKFSCWEVLSILPFEYRKQSKCICRCKCGKENTVEVKALIRGKSKRCTSCAAIESHPCKVCGCKGRHKNINIEEIICDHIGFCPVCDDFDVTSIHIDNPRLLYRSKRIKRLLKLEKIKI